MTDPVPLVLLGVIVVLTILLVVLGIQVFFILKDLRVTIAKTNKVLDNADAITSDVEGALSTVSSLTMGVKATTFFTIAKFVKNFLSRDKDSDERRRHRE